MGKQAKTGIIFGKFYPIHIGHINFINQISEKVEKLYIVMCTDKDRDIRLFNESKMTKVFSNETRKKIIEDNLKFLANIEVIHLVEDGVPPYPKGWYSWTKRVEQLLEKNDIKIDIIYTNEKQDVAEYYDNFRKYMNMKYLDENFEVVTLDINRSNIHISATEIRKNPVENWEYIPMNVKPFFE